MTARSLLALAVALALAIGGFGAMPSTVAATTGVLYVDGKTGSDSWDGSSPTRAFRTIAKASGALPKGADAAGWRVVVQGYRDHVYRERPVPPGWGRTGTASAPVTFQAAGYVAAKSSYVKPIVSGADPVPLPGNSWTATSVPGVWSTPFGTTPFGYGKAATTSLPTALFQDLTTWLWEQPSLSALETRARTGRGGYWYDTAAKRLYVSAATTTGSVQGTDPTGRAIDVIVRNGFLIDGRSGGDYIAVRGFEVRHSANGIAYLYGADGGTVADNVLTGNLWMGVSISGYQTASGPDGAVGHTVWRNRASANTIQGIKLTNGASKASVCYNDAFGNGLQGIKVEGMAPGSGYTGVSSGITLCGNMLHHQRFNPTGSAYNNASGLTIANGAQAVTVRDNSIWYNDVGIHVTQEASGQQAMNGVTFTRNRISANRRFGLYFFDGYRGPGNGSMTASLDVIWGNGIGVMVDRGSTNKKLVSETIHGNVAEGIKIGGYQVAPASVSITTSLITGNGGFGVWLVTGNTASLTWSGLSGNARGGVTGTPSQSGNNAKDAGYLSLLPASKEHLRISSTSYQYTAGPKGTPIGARY